MRQYNALLHIVHVAKTIYLLQTIASRDTQTTYIKTIYKKKYCSFVNRPTWHYDVFFSPFIAHFSSNNFVRLRDFSSNQIYKKIISYIRQFVKNLLDKLYLLVYMIIIVPQNSQVQETIIPEIDVRDIYHIRKKIIQLNIVLFN